MDICRIDDCSNKRGLAKGLCSTHYHRLLKTGSTDPIPRVNARRPCSMEGCERISQAKGLCEKHYRRLLKHGDPHREVKSGLRRREYVGYSGAHLRVKADRGDASEHPCCVCGSPGRQWAYDHQDPGELFDPKAGRGKGRTYSSKSEHYKPMCAPCHVSYDLEHRGIPEGWRRRGRRVESADSWQGGAGS